MLVLPGSKFIHLNSRPRLPRKIEKGVAQVYGQTLQKYGFARNKCGLVTTLFDTVMDVPAFQEDGMFNVEKRPMEAGRIWDRLLEFKQSKNQMSRITLPRIKVVARALGFTKYKLPVPLPEEILGVECPNDDAFPGVYYRFHGVKTKKEAWSAAVATSFIHLQRVLQDDVNIFDTVMTYGIGQREKPINFVNELLEGEALGSKMARIVMMPEAEEYAFSRPLQRALQDRIAVDPSSPLYITGSYHGDRLQRLQKRFMQSKVLYCLDHKKHDATVPRQIVEMSFRVLIHAFEPKDEGEAAILAKWVLQARQWFVSKHVITPSGWVVKIDSGTPTGSIWTSIINSISTYIILHIVFSSLVNKAKGKLLPNPSDYFTIVASGDDSIVGMRVDDLDITIQQIKDAYARIVDMKVDDIDSIATVQFGSKFDERGEVEHKGVKFLGKYFDEEQEFVPRVPYSEIVPKMLWKRKNNSRCVWDDCDHVLSVGLDNPACPRTASLVRSVLMKSCKFASAAPIIDQFEYWRTRLKASLQGSGSMRAVLKNMAFQGGTGRLRYSDGKMRGSYVSLWKYLTDFGYVTMLNASNKAVTWPLT